MSAALIFLLSYLLGSLVAGIIYSRRRGDDIRGRDLPGGSGTFRQYGRQAAIVVSVLDILKGVLAGLLALWLAPDWLWVAALGAVLGHCYPVFFRFQGGGGIAPYLGVMLVAAPLTILATVALALALIPLYKATLQPALKLNAIPFVTAVSVPVGLLIASRLGGTAPFLAGGAAMLLRAAHLLLSPAVREGKLGGNSEP